MSIMSRENGDGEERKKKKKSPRNKERVLVFSSRGASYRTRHLLNDFKTLMPHSKAESKLDKRTSLKEMSEVMSMANCSKAIFFECKKRKDVYIWVASLNGPSVKFLLHNVHTMEELRLAGNCLKGSRPVIAFDALFDSPDTPHLTLIKQLFSQTFSTPDRHPRSQPFIDHVFTFSLTPDKHIWFRNFQILDSGTKLQEIGPRMVLEMIRVYDGCFDGDILYENPLYESPNELRRRLKMSLSDRYSKKKDSMAVAENRRLKRGATHDVDQLEAVFDPQTTTGQVRELELSMWNAKKKKKMTTMGKEAVFDPQTTTGQVRDLELSMGNGKKKMTTMGKEAVFDPQTTTGQVRELELSMWNGKKKKTMGKRGGEDASC